MKVPISHYIYFWIINSIMAFATGLVMGYFALKTLGSYFFKPPIEFPQWCYLIFPCGFFFIFQFITPSYFWRKRRGEFEYSFLEKSALKKMINPELGSQLKSIKRELKFGGVNSAHEKLIAATKAFPDNFVTHFMFALSCERMGLSEDAIKAYDTARKLTPETSEALITYIEKQISRVKLEGPSKMSTAPGLQYLMW
jgi:hypothetical protein